MKSRGRIVRSRSDRDSHRQATIEGSRRGQLSAGLNPVKKIKKRTSGGTDTLH